MGERLEIPSSALCGWQFPKPLESFPDSNTGKKILFGRIPGNPSMEAEIIQEYFDQISSYKIRLFFLGEEQNAQITFTQISGNLLGEEEKFPAALFWSPCEENQGKYPPPLTMINIYNSYNLACIYGSAAGIILDIKKNFPVKYLSSDGEESPWTNIPFHEWQKLGKGVFIKISPFEDGLCLSLVTGLGEYKEGRMFPSIIIQESVLPVGNDAFLWDEFLSLLKGSSQELNYPRKLYDYLTAKFKNLRRTATKKEERIILELVDK